MGIKNWTGIISGDNSSFWRWQQRLLLYEIGMSKFERVDASEL